MKNFIATILYVFTLFSFTTKNQINDTISNPDSISFIQFDMSPKDFEYSTTNASLLNKSNFLTKFGKPFKQTTKYSKLNNTYLTHFIYKGAESWYKNDTLKTLIFTNSNYKFILSNGITIKVGDSISRLSKLFPNSWNHRKSSLKNQVYVGLVNSFGPLDAGLIFEFKPSNGLISTIALFK